MWILSNGYCYFHFCKWEGEAFLIEITESQDSNSGVLKSTVFFPPEKFSVMELLAKHVSDLRCIELLTFSTCWFFWRIINGYKWHVMNTTPRGRGAPCLCYGSWHKCGSLLLKLKVNAYRPGVSSGCASAPCEPLAIFVGDIFVSGQAFKL